MKQMPISFRAVSECFGSAETLTPNSVRTSALPDLLLAARLPCLATGRPAAAITKAAAVETLNVLALLEPVPAVSIKQLCCDCKRTERDRSADASPANSATVSPFEARATNTADI